MIPHVPEQRKFKSNAGKPFDDLVEYITEEQETVLEPGKGVKKDGKGQSTSPDFSDLIDYATAKIDKESKDEKCIAVRTHGVSDISTASIEMNAVARKNHKCKDAAYHIILSWPEHEHPSPDSIFDAAEHALDALGLKEHQYVLAVHGNTDNTHCHISVNRVHPVTFKARHIEWAIKTLHMAARQSEIKHGWTHDNGIYIVQTDGHGKKTIVLNPDHTAAVGRTTPYAHAGKESDPILPTWHDPESLDSWLKTKVARALKRDLTGLADWPALHAWLSHYDITLSDSGGGGMRLHAVSAETGEILDLAVSKGLRILKRAELEKRWGAFSSSTPVTSIVPDLTHLTDHQIAQGVEDVLSRDRNPTRDPRLPPEHVVRAQQHRSEIETERSGSLHELSTGSMDDDRQGIDLPLSDSLHGDVGDQQAGKNPDLRRAGPGAEGSRSERSLKRDDSKRAERKEQRAAARADLRQRFEQYKRFVRVGDTEHFKRTKKALDERRLAFKHIADNAKAAKKAIPADTPHAVRVIATVEIDAESLRRRLEAESAYQQKVLVLRGTRTPPLSWRAWLYEQANLGDQAALSALRGIVYQAQRDAKSKDGYEPSDVEAGQDVDDYREQEYHKAMARLLDEEKSELAIRPGNPQSMRPHEVDALLRRYKGIQWTVTGNGNVEYRDHGGHLFTDRGNRITFDRVRVTDQEIRLALAHAQIKFGNSLTLTGTDPVFAERMARLAVEMNIRVLNPELQAIVSQHRARNKLRPAVDVESSLPALAVDDGTSPTRTIEQHQDAVAGLSDDTPAASVDPEQQLRDLVLAIDPKARFVVPAAAGAMRLYLGPIAVQLPDPGTGFAQHTGRSTYALHAAKAPPVALGSIVEVKYESGVVLVGVHADPQRTQERLAIDGADRVPAPPIGAPEAPVTTQSAPSELTAHEWLAKWSEESNKRVGAPTAESGSAEYTVVYVAPDGVVIDKGRTGVVYPVPDGLPLKAGDMVTVGRTAQLETPIERDLDGGKTPGR